MDIGSECRSWGIRYLAPDRSVPKGRPPFSSGAHRTERGPGGIPQVDDHRRLMAKPLSLHPLPQKFRLRLGEPAPSHRQSAHRVGCSSKLRGQGGGGWGGWGPLALAGHWQRGGAGLEPKRGGGGA